MFKFLNPFKKNEPYKEPENPNQGSWVHVCIIKNKNRFGFYLNGKPQKSKGNWTVDFWSKGFITDNDVDPKHKMIYQIDGKVVKDKPEGEFEKIVVVPGKLINFITKKNKKKKGK